MNVANWIERNADFSPNKVALRCEGREMTYAELAVQVETVAKILKWELGVGRGDRVALLGYNSPEILILLFACARLGAMMIPLNWRLAIPEHLYILQDASVKVLFLEESFTGLIEPAGAAMPRIQIVGLDFTPVDGLQWNELLTYTAGDSYNPHVTLETPLLIVYTSGTTGRPKGSVITQNALQWNAINSIHMHDMTSQDHILTPLPMFHVGGLNNQTTPALHCGATITLHRRFHPDQALEAITDDKPTLVCLVPTTMQACIDSDLWANTDFSNLRILLTGSTTVPKHTSDTWREKGVVVLEVYGSTETCPIAIYQRPDSDFSKHGSVGMPGLHCQVRIVDNDGNELSSGQEGEVLVKGPNVMFEYWGNEAATAAALRNGWYHTGDIGYRDEDGYYYIRGRKKNMIISGGENIYPAEVERVLYTHPAIAETAVIGIPDQNWQELPVAVIVLQKGMSVTAEELSAFLGKQLARYKLPHRFIFTTELPKNVMGKIQHFRVREQFQDIIQA
ncbi:MAG: long-chain fatty acid--CoA ligase [Chloroflexi bacterium]|nr:long-chain fatty acid--CoA ligase [Chloroflexota bacterium]